MFDIGHPGHVPGMGHFWDSVTIIAKRPLEIGIGLTDESVNDGKGYLLFGHFPGKFLMGYSRADLKS